MVTSGPAIDQSVLLKTIRELDEKLQDEKKNTMEWKKRTILVLAYNGNAQDTVPLKEMLYTAERERDIATTRLSEMNVINNMNYILQERISHMEMELHASRESFNQVQCSLDNACAMINNGVQYEIERDVRVGDQISMFQWQLQQAHNDQEWFKERNTFLEQEVVNAQALITNMDMERSTLQQQVDELEKQLAAAMEEKNEFTARVTRERLEMGKQLDTRMRQIERLEADFLEGRRVYHEATKRCEIEEKRLRQKCGRVASGTLRDGYDISSPSEISDDKRSTWSGSPVDSPAGKMEKAEKNGSIHLNPNILHYSKNSMSNEEGTIEKNVPLDNSSKEGSEGCEDVDAGTEKKGEIKHDGEVMEKDTDKPERDMIRKRRSPRQDVFNMDSQRMDKSETSPRVLSLAKAPVRMSPSAEEGSERRQEIDKGERKMQRNKREENNGAKEDIFARSRRSYEAHVARVSRNRKNN